jgi:hypothetical protein
MKAIAKTSKAYGAELLVDGGLSCTVATTLNLKSVTTFVQIVHYLANEQSTPASK